jgi:hypothetical protein
MSVSPCHEVLGEVQRGEEEPERGGLHGRPDVAAQVDFESKIGK